MSLPSKATIDGATRRNYVENHKCIFSSPSFPLQKFSCRADNELVLIGEERGCAMVPGADRKMQKKGIQGVC